MKKILTIIFVIIMISTMSAQVFPNLGAQRTGTSALQFLKIGNGARANGMGESYVAVANDAEALYWNPAGISRFEKHAFLFSHTQWVVDIDLEFAGFVYHLDPTNSLGLQITYLHTDEMKETTELQPFGTGRYFNYSDFVLGLTYARNMTEQFSFGMTLKYFQENIVELTTNGLLFDLGTYYDTGWKSIRFAVAVTNFGQDIAPVGEFEYQDLAGQQQKIDDFQSSPPPTAFRIGIAAELYQTEYHQLTSSIQLNHPNDNDENINIGFEYWWNNLVALRAGYKTARMEEDFSAGLGCQLPLAFTLLKIDYAFTNFGRLGYVNRFSVHFEL